MALLSMRSISKRFGALLVTDDVSLDVEAGEIHALIGPNGAGKTTLVSETIGELRPDSGSIFFDGRDVTELAAHDRAMLGMARSFQIAAICPSLTVIENVMLAVQVHRGHNFRFWRSVSDNDAIVSSAREVLDVIGLADCENMLVSSLAHGQQRRLDIAMAIAGTPKLLLLDEPLAGLGPGEASEMADYIRSLRGRYAMLLVEHDMDVVFSLADTISVLDCGRCIATGTPDEIRNNEEVRAAYLGNEDE
ncbi:Branched-chain amino acid transport system ATP-binding protein OS=Castellaniella defragrans OX=75697 GN=HNR28_002270 PE=4 SV=1 [Castellaniella defragrans]